MHFYCLNKVQDKSHLGKDQCCLLLPELKKEKSAKQQYYIFYIICFSRILKPKGFQEYTLQLRGLTIYDLWAGSSHEAIGSGLWQCGNSVAGTLLAPRCTILTAGGWAVGNFPVPCHSWVEGRKAEVVVAPAVGSQHQLTLDLRWAIPACCWKKLLSTALHQTSW